MFIGGDLREKTEERNAAESGNENSARRNPISTENSAA
jgi:hypothetical protein